jgi:hypothetical protein
MGIEALPAGPSNSQYFKESVPHTKIQTANVGSIPAIIVRWYRLMVGQWYKKLILIRIL